MSPAMKSKSKSSAKPVKEQQQKASSKLSTAPVNGGSSIPGGAYNPISGTFHALEKASSAPSTPPSNGRFQTIDEREEHSGSSNGNPEYDSVSNGSCSGDSEDPKERAAASAKPQREAIPGSDTDKRDKIRQKNERKHQRQRERRAQELHERCSVYLTSRKLEVLSQQLVAMGFPAERATTALILNEGRVEESIAWLLEGEQLNAAASLDAGSNLRIDISDELAKTADLETEFRCSKQEVERAIVACEGDLEKAAEVLKAQKQEPPVSPSRLGGSGEPAAAIGEHGVAMSGQNAIARTQVKAVNLAATPQEERDFNYSKAVVTGTVLLGSKGRNLQSPRPQTKVDSSSSSSSSRPQVPPAVEKRWPGAIANPSASISYPSASPPPTFLASSPVGAPPAKVEPRYAVVGSEAKTSQRAAALKEPVVVMQRPPQTNSKLPGLPSSAAAASGASPAAATTTTTTSGGWWYPSGGASNVEAVKVSIGGLGASLQAVAPTTTRGFGSPTVQYNMSRQHHHHQPFCMGSRVDTAPVGWGGGTWSNSVGMSSGTSTTTSSSPSSASLTVPSSLGLFTGWGSSGSSGSSSPVDWSTGGSMMQCDYASIDWSLDSAPSRPPSKAGGHRHQDWLHDAWATAAFTGARVGRARAGIDGGARVAGRLQDGARLVAMDPLPTAGSHEWTSPFAGKDLFSLSRRFVTSPPL